MTGDDESEAPSAEIVRFIRGISRRHSRGPTLKRVGRYAFGVLLVSVGISSAFMFGEIRALGFARAWHEYGRWWFELPAIFFAFPFGGLVGLTVLELIARATSFAFMFSLETATGLISRRARAASPNIAKVLLLAATAVFVVWWGYNIALDDVTPRAVRGRSVTGPRPAAVAEAAPGSRLEKTLPFVGIWLLGVVSKAVSDFVKDALKERLAKTRVPAVQLLGADGRPLERDEE